VVGQRSQTGRSPLTATVQRDDGSGLAELLPLINGPRAQLLAAAGDGAGRVGYGASSPRAKNVESTASVRSPWQGGIAPCRRVEASSISNSAEPSDEPDRRSSLSKRLRKHGCACWQAAPPAPPPQLLCCERPPYAGGRIVRGASRRLAAAGVTCVER